MAQYTEADIENALADIQNGVPKSTAAMRHGIPRTTLRGRISGSRHHKIAYNNMQQLSIVQEENLARWVLFHPTLRCLNNLVSWLDPQHLDSLATKAPNNLSFITA
jgi:hypothetical protein